MLREGKRQSKKTGSASLDGIKVVVVDILMRRLREVSARKPKMIDGLCAAWIALHKEEIWGARGQRLMNDLGTTVCQRMLRAVQDCTSITLRLCRLLYTASGSMILTDWKVFLHAMIGKDTAVVIELPVKA